MESAWHRYLCDCIFSKNELRNLSWPERAEPPPAHVCRPYRAVHVPYPQVCFEMAEYSDLTYVTYDGLGNLWAALYDESEACCPVGGRGGGVRVKRGDSA